MTTMFRKWHMELWRLRKHYLCNAICHKCKASKNPGRYQKTAVGFIIFLVPINQLRYMFFLGWDDMEYQGILKAFVKWWWGIQPFGTSTTHLGLLCPNFIQTAFLLYVPWRWLSDSGQVWFVYAICIQYTWGCANGWTPAPFTFWLTMGIWDLRDRHYKSTSTSSTGDSTVGAQWPAYGGPRKNKTWSYFLFCIYIYVLMYD